MAQLRIFCDFAFDENAVRLLKEGAFPHEVVIPQRPDISFLSASPIAPAFFDCDIALGQVDVESVLKSERLRWLHVSSAGFTRYDTPEFRNEAQKRGFLVTNSSSVYDEPCAEHLVAFMLAQARQLPQTLGTRFPISSPQWNGMRKCFCLTGQEVVILGYGAIAARLVEILAPFRMRITAMRRKARGNETVPIVSLENLPSALATADHVINILPDNAESQHFVSAERFSQMKPRALFYNIGRGSTVDQNALAASLHVGQIAAAWLDVTTPEPLPDGHILLTAPNCFITPHFGGCHRNEYETMARHFLENLRRFTTDQPLNDRIM